MIRHVRAAFLKQCLGWMLYGDLDDLNGEFFVQIRHSSHNQSGTSIRESFMTPSGNMDGSHPSNNHISKSGSKETHSGSNSIPPQFGLPPSGMESSQDSRGQNEHLQAFFRQLAGSDRKNRLEDKFAKLFRRAMQKASHGGWLDEGNSSQGTSDYHFCLHLLTLSCRAYSNDLLIPPPPPPPPPSPSLPNAHIYLSQVWT